MRYRLDKVESHELQQSLRLLNKIKASKAVSESDVEALNYLAMSVFSLANKASKELTGEPHPWC